MIRIVLKKLSINIEMEGCFPPKTLNWEIIPAEKLKPNKSLKIESLYRLKVYKTVAFSFSFEKADTNLKLKWIASKALSYLK